MRPVLQDHDSPVRGVVATLSLALLLAVPAGVRATPANRATLGQHYDRFLAKKLNQCTTCHLPGAQDNAATLEEFPHNAFGQALRELAGDPATPTNGPGKALVVRLAAVAALDSDRDGVPNEAELLLGHNPGNASDVPTAAERESLADHQREFARFLTSYRWRPFETVRRPPVPAPPNRRWIRNPVDAFLAAAHAEKGLSPRPEARRDVLLRRVYLDLIGLVPTPEEQRAFLADTSSRAYENVVDRLLEDPRHGERWGRHWMDVWRYSDWAGWADGNQIRDSKPHIWRWRDWIVESLNGDKGYDRMLVEMLAADELAPLDTNALRATGFLVRNYKMLSREQWLEDTIKHTSQAFLGMTLGCAKCHDHMTDPISQVDYYRVRSIFEPHHVRTDKVPGQLDPLKDGLVRAFDTASNAITRFLMRGDERHPDTNRVIEAGVPVALCGDTRPGRDGGRLAIRAVELPWLAAQPDRRESVRRDVIAASERSVAEAAASLARAQTNGGLAPEKLREEQLLAAVAGAKHRALLAVVDTERLEDAGRKGSHEWTMAAMAAREVQRTASVEEARLKVHREDVALAAAQKSADATAGETKESKESKDLKDLKDGKARAEAATKAVKDLEAARKKQSAAASALAAAEKDLAAPSNTSYAPRSAEHFPRASTGRRLAFVHWLVDPGNPLTARVAMNHLWMRHFGRGLVATPTDFGRGGRPPSHPQLLDWLAAEFVDRGWSMKQMHRLLVTSAAYRMASTPDDANAARDPDNVWLWRMPSRRLEAEAIRDNLLYAAGDLDPAMGGADIDHKLGLTSKRRSLYLRLAAEKEVEFLRIFDGPTVTECYERRPSVMPQQALALGNSEIALRQASRLAARIDPEAPGNDDFIYVAYERILARRPRTEEVALCREFLAGGQTVNPQPMPAGAESGGPLSQTLSDTSSTFGRSDKASDEVSDKAAKARRLRRRENLVLVLLNHNDFVTIR